MYLLKFSDNNFNFIEDNTGFEDETKAISNEIYEQMINELEAGKQYRIKDFNGQTFEEIFEEYIPQVHIQPKSEIEILKERLETVQLAMDEMIMDVVEGSLK